ncbi:MAG: MBL fold metallo-hydrolase [Oscillospiraceae bacterium]|nr:MBL fold metallo-hydrolase [Oscillospiraceae bacterium]
MPLIGKRKSRKGRRSAGPAAMLIILALAGFAILSSVQDKYGIDLGIPEVPSIQVMAQGWLGLVDSFLGESPTASTVVSPDAFDDVRVHFIDVGQGKSILIQTKSGNALIDAGERDRGEAVTAYLRRQGVRELDFLIATHPHSDHIGGMGHVLQSMNVGMIIMPVIPQEVSHTTRTYTDLLTAIDRAGKSVTAAKPGDVYELGVNSGISITILGPVETYNDVNNHSVVSRLDYGEVSFLFTGDIEAWGERDVAKSGQRLRANVLDVAHHGSQTSSTDEFLRAVRPQIAVISCGMDNSYGHPARDAVERLRESGAQVLRTDLNGTVVVSTNGREIHIDTQ